MEGPAYPPPTNPQPYSGYQPPPQAPPTGYQPAPADFKADPNAGAIPPAYYPPPPQQQQACNVVITQPSTGARTVTYHAVGDNYLTLSVVLTMMCILCCTWYGLFCTVPAIIFATMAREAESRGNYAAARTNANLALGCNIGGVVWWVIATCIIIVSISVALSTGASTVYYYYSTYCYYSYSYYSYYCYK